MDTSCQLPARQLGVNVQPFTIRVFRGNPMLMKMIVILGVGYKCNVLFDQWCVYFVLTDETVSIICQTEVAIHLRAGLVVSMEYLRTSLFAKIQTQTKCTLVDMTVRRYCALTISSSFHMTAFFKQHMPLYDEYDVYLRVCTEYRITPYTRVPVVNKLWSLLATLKGALI